MIFSKKHLVAPITLMLGALFVAQPHAVGATKKSKPGSVVVKDSAGATIRLAKPAVRVVCLTGICTDTLFTLGLMPVAATDKLHLSPLFYGSKGSKVAAVGGSFFEPSLEDIAAAKPDLVIGLAGVHDGLRKGLEKIAPLYVSGPKGYDGMLAETLNIGRLVGKQKEITAAQSRLNKKLDGLTKKVPAADRKSVVIIYGSDVNINASTLDDPPVDALSKVANYGFTARASGQDFPKFTLDDLLKLNPDAIFVMTVGFGATPPAPVSEQLAANPIWSQLKATKAKAVYEVSFDIWGTTRGLRGTSLVLDEAFAKLYPGV